MTGNWYMLNIKINHQKVQFSIYPTKKEAFSMAKKLMKDNPIIESVEVEVCGYYVYT